MNGQVEVTWRTLRTVAHALMVHARVPEIYVHFTLMYTTDFEEECQTRGVRLTLGAPEHQDMSGQVEVNLENVAYNCTLSYGTC